MPAEFIITQKRMVILFEPEEDHFINYQLLRVCTGNDSKKTVPPKADTLFQK